MKPAALETPEGNRVVAGPLYGGVEEVGELGVHALRRRNLRIGDDRIQRWRNHDLCVIGDDRPGCSRGRSRRRSPGGAAVEIPMVDVHLHLAISAET